MPSDNILEMTRHAPLIVFSTGDLSGDMHAAHLVPRIRDEWKSRHPDSPNIRFAAAGSNHLRDAGVEIWEDTTTWGVIGIIEGLKILPELLAGKKRMIGRIREESPDLVIAVDFRSFNMSLLKDIRIRADKSRQKTAYYIAPVLWWTGDKKTKERKMVGKVVDIAKTMPGSVGRSARDRFEAMAELCDLALVA